MPCKMCNMRFAKQYSIYCEYCTDIHNNFTVAKYNLQRILYPIAFSNKFKLDIYGQYYKS